MTDSRRQPSQPGRDTSPVTTLLDRARRWSDDDWWRLEAAAWWRHRRVVVALAGGAPHHLWAALLERHARNPIFGILSFLASIGAIVAVLFGVAHAAGWVFWGAERADIGMAGLLFGLVAVLMGWQTWQGRHTVSSDPGLYRITGLLLTAPSCFALFGALAASSVGIEVVGLVGAIGIAASVAVGVAMVVLGFRRSIPTSRADRVSREIARVPDADRRSAEDDLAMALDVLASRGLITQEQHETARAAAPGALGLTLGTPRVEATKG